ncbi:50S ribosomal protein L11 methyltransferase [uncultured Neglectibacter sp.]|uniref:50S ribosomal protein L11 methyltransferase n=1 Tax=uncultured Neglectibacter sp. TaxID=1924108 RepID=UPI0034DEAEF6
MDESWTEVKIEVPADRVDLAGDIANMVVPYGIYIEDYSNLEAEAMEIAHIDLIDEELLAKDRSKAIVHVYISPEANPAEAISFLEERYRAEKIPHEISCASCVKEDWINNWKKYFKPIPVGKKLLIRPIWEENFDADGRIVLDLEPGLAFGTGTHETTRLCLELLEKYISPGCEFLDMGCGSGILSVAALLLGAKSAVGVDIDPLAVKTAVENAKSNGVEERFTGICGNLADKVSGKFQVVAANIVADIVILLSKDAPRFLEKDSVYIVSGIIDAREDDVLSALSDTFTVLERREEKGWVAMALKLKTKKVKE